MSPYVACMNTFCAYPAPEAISRALVLAHHDSAHPHHPGEIANGSSEGFVPLETIERDEGKTVDRAEVNYWRFVGVSAGADRQHTRRAASMHAEPVV